MPDQLTIVNQVVKEIIKGKDDTGEYGHWTLYKIKFMQSDRKYSWFAGDDERVPSVGQNLLVVKYTEETKGKYTNYTIKKMEFDPTSQVSTQQVSEPTYEPLNKSYDSNVSMYVAYAKDILIEQMKYNPTLQTTSHFDLCKAVALRGKMMLDIAKGGTPPAKTAAKTAQPKPVAPPVQQPKTGPIQQPEPVDVPNVPFDDVVPPPDEPDLPF